MKQYPCKIFTKPFLDPLNSFPTKKYLNWTASETATQDKQTNKTIKRGSVSLVRRHPVALTLRQGEEIESGKAKESGAGDDTALVSKCFPIFFPVLHCRLQFMLHCQCCGVGVASWHVLIKRGNNVIIKVETKDKS